MRVRKKLNVGLHGTAVRMLEKEEFEETNIASVIKHIQNAMECILQRLDDIQHVILLAIENTYVSPPSLLRDSGSPNSGFHNEHNAFFPFAFLIISSYLCFPFMSKSAYTLCLLLPLAFILPIVSTL